MQHVAKCGAMHAHRPALAVFAGPSLPLEDRLQIERVTYLPPAARGDVKSAAMHYDAVLLIDGVFHHDLAPSPKECYAALAHARLFGAASMGALRAAECAPYGFTPLGAIAGWYTRDLIDGEDEVAVLTHPERHDALSVALVNVRYIARLAYCRGLLDTSQRETLVERARRIFYMDRTWEDVADLAPAAIRDALLDLAYRYGDLKRKDARFALRSVLRWRDRLARPLVLPSEMPKAPGTYDRAVPYAQTAALVPELRRRYGITRLADTTYLDRTGIPTYSALVPHSPDLLGVYNGKGLTPQSAMVSAVMEATERQIGAAVPLPSVRVALREVGKRIDLLACGMREDVDDCDVACVFGTELLSGDVLPVPLAMVACPWFGDRLLNVTSSNGLASGNNRTEAIYHALCELVERHAWTMYHVRSSLLPRFYLGADAKDRALAPEIALPADEPLIDALVRKIRAGDLVVRAFALAEGTLPLTVLATVTEPHAPLPMAHMGLGCALSPAHALTRALTEAVQSRVVDIQAAREDILRPGEAAGIMGTHGRRLRAVPNGAWCYDVPSAQIALADLEDRATGDLAQDLARVLESLRAYDIANVIAVDLSPKDLPIGVVRAIVPGLETYAFSGHLGARARAELNPFTLRL